MKDVRTPMRSIELYLAASVRELDRYGRKTTGVQQQAKQLLKGEERHQARRLAYRNSQPQLGSGLGSCGSSIGAKGLGLVFFFFLGLCSSFHALEIEKMCS